MGRTCRIPLRCLTATSFFLVIILCSFAGSVKADPIAERPQISFDAPVFDFGTISEGAVVAHQFTVKNAGSAPLTIQKVVAGCGCTAAAASTDPIPPGQTGTVNVTFDSSGFTGSKTKEVRVFSNDPDTPASVVSLRGYIESAVVLDPPRIAFGEIRRGEMGRATQDVSVSVKPESGMTITSIRSFTKALAIKELGGDAQSRRFKVSMTQDAPSGEIRERVIVALRDASGKETAVNVPVIASVKGPLRLDPGVISFGVIDGSSRIERSVKFTNTGKDNLSIRSISSSDEAVTATVKPVQDGKAWVIHVSVDPAKISRDLRASLQILTDSKEQDTVTLNVYGVLPPRG